MSTQPSTSHAPQYLTILIEQLAAMPFVLNHPDGTYTSTTLAAAPSPLFVTAKESFTKFFADPVIGSLSPALFGKLTIETFSRIAHLVDGEHLTTEKLNALATSLRIDLQAPNGALYQELIASIPYWKAALDPIPLGLVSYPAHYADLENDTDLGFSPDEAVDEPEDEQENTLGDISDDELTDDFMNEEDDAPDYPSLLDDEMQQPITLHQTVETSRRLHALLALAQADSHIPPRAHAPLHTLARWLIARDKAQSTGDNLFAQQHDLPPEAYTTIMVRAIRHAADASTPAEQLPHDLSPESPFITSMLQAELSRSPETRIERETTSHLKTIAGAHYNELPDPAILLRQ